MEFVKISSKFQIIIPKKVRERLQIVPGQRLQIVAYGNRIEMIPEQKIGSMRGFLPGIDTTVSREDDRL